jgi:RNA polymerase sigma-70 factor (ECF subfamily)
VEAGWRKYPRADVALRLSFAPLLENWPVSVLTICETHCFHFEEQMSATVFHVIGEPLEPEFEAIFRDHARLVYRTAFSVTGSPQDAEDIVQNLFLHLLKRGIPPGLRENPKAYLYRAAVNLALNSVKSRRCHLSTSEAELPEPRVESVELHEADSKEHLRRRLVDAMAQLNPRFVELLILRYEHNYSDAEIGKMLGTSRGAIAVTLFRARARLKKLMRLTPGEK